MSLVRVGSFEALSVRLDLPRFGAASAICEIDTASDEPPTGAASIDFLTTEAVSFVGSIVLPVGKDAPRLGRSRLRWASGVAAMTKTLAGKPYANVAPRLVVEDILSDAGETAGDITSALAALPTQRLWLRPSGPAAQALTRFLSGSGLAWRFSPAGRVDVVQETWPAYTGDALLVRHPDEQGRALYALEQPTLYPGMTLDGARVDRVVHLVASDGTFRSEVVFI